MHERNESFRRPGTLTARRPIKSKRWSHQDELDALKGKVVLVYPLDGGTYEGTLVEADQFAIKVLTPNHGVGIVWKHALRSVVEKR